MSSTLYEELYMVDSNGKVEIRQIKVNQVQDLQDLNFTHSSDQSLPWLGPGFRKLMEFWCLTSPGQFCNGETECVPMFQHCSSFILPFFLHLQIFTTPEKRIRIGTEAVLFVIFLYTLSSIKSQRLWFSFSK